MHVYDDPAHGRSSVFQKEKRKEKKYVCFFVFWIDHLSFKNPHLYKIKNNPLSIWGTIFPTLEKTVCLCRSHLDKTESHVVCKLSVLSDKIFSKKQKQNTNFIFNIAYSSYKPWFVNYKLFRKLFFCKQQVTCKNTQWTSTSKSSVWSPPRFDKKIPF